MAAAPLRGGGGAKSRGQGELSKGARGPLVAGALVAVLVAGRGGLLLPPLLRLNRHLPLVLGGGGAGAGTGEGAEGAAEVGQGHGAAPPGPRRAARSAPPPGPPSARQRRRRPRAPGPRAPRPAPPRITHVFPVVQALEVVIGKGLALGGVVGALVLDALQGYRGWGQRGRGAGAGGGGGMGGRRGAAAAPAARGEGNAPAGGRAAADAQTRGPPLRHARASPSPGCRRRRPAP
jgi:hypothetical protein